MLWSETCNDQVLTPFFIMTSSWCKKKSESIETISSAANFLTSLCRQTSSQSLADIRRVVKFITLLNRCFHSNYQVFFFPTTDWLTRTSHLFYETLTAQGENINTRDKEHRQKRKKNTDRSGASEGQQSWPAYQHQSAWEGLIYSFCLIRALSLFLSEAE